MALSMQAKARLQRLAVAFGLLVCASGMNALSSLFIKAHFPARPLVPDLLLELLPRVEAFQYVADVFSGVVPACMLAALAAQLRTACDRPLGDAFAMAALLYVFRAALIVLTPMLSPHGNATGKFGLLPPQTGMFPSGHTALVFLAYLVVVRGTGAPPAQPPPPAQKQPWLRVAFALLVCFEMLALLLSRGHYSIDLVGGLLLCYFVHTEYTTHGAIFAPVHALINRFDNRALPPALLLAPSASSSSSSAVVDRDSDAEDS